MANNQLLALDSFASGAPASGWSATPGNTAWVLTGGAPYYAEPTAANTSCSQLWTGVASWPNDQICEVTIETCNATGTFNQVQLRVRNTYNGSSNSGYLAIIKNAAGTQTAGIYRNDAGTTTDITGLITVTIASGDVWSFGVFGSVLALYQNGIRVAYIGDATYASGTPGFDVYAQSGVTNCQVKSWRGYSAIQQDGVWTKKGVIFAATAAEVADSTDFGSGVSPLQGVIYEGNPKVLTQYSQVYKSWFTNAVFPGVGYAESPDGVVWTRYPSAVLANYSNGGVYKYNGTYYHWGQKATQIATGTAYMTTSLDGINWAAEQATDISTVFSGLSAYFDFAVIDVINGTFYVLFSALNGTNSAPNTYAASSTDGINWTALNSGNPVIANVYGEVQIIKVGTIYYCWGVANQPGQGNATASGFDPLEGVLYSITQASMIAGGTWNFIHHSLHNTGMWESLNSKEAGVYATSILQFGNCVGMYYEGSPGDSTGPQIYQGGLALGPLGSTLASIIAANEDGSTQVASDAFTGGAGPLSANWTTCVHAMQIVAGNLCEGGTTGGSFNGALYTGASFAGVTPTTGQYSEITIATIAAPAGSYILQTRVCCPSNASNSGYLFQVVGPTGTEITTASGNALIFAQLNGATLNTSPAFQFTPNVGDVIRLSVTQGNDGFNVLTVTQNGFTIAIWVDYTNSLTTGYPGMGVNAATTLADAQISKWAGGNISVPVFNLTAPTPPTGFGNSSWLTANLNGSLRGLRK